MIAGRNRAMWWDVAVGLTLVGAAAGQTGSPAPAPLPTTVAAAMPAVASPAALGRLSEIKVRLAWLTDPTTSVLPLTVRCQRDVMMEVSGTAPSEETRARALEIARLNSDLSILDALIVGRVNVPAAREETPARLNLQATNALMEAGFLAIQDLQVQAHPDGMIVLLGSIGSYEEKLQASQRLRKLAGCKCVDNRIEVRSVTNSRGQAWWSVTADGRLKLPVDNPLPVKPVTVEALPAPAAIVRPPKPVAIRPRIATAHVDPAVTRAVFEVKPAPGFTVKPMGLPEAVGAAVARVVPVKCALPVVPVEPRKVDVADPSTAEIPCAVAKPTAVHLRSAPETESPEEESEPVAAKAMPVAAKGPEPMETPAPGSLAEWYRQRIARECKLDLDCVFVTFPTATDIVVTLRIGDRARAGRLCTKVTRISELAPYHVKIQTVPRP